MNEYPQIVLPDCESGDAKIVNFEITKKEADFAAMRCAFNHRVSIYDRPPTPGKHVRLEVGGEVMMSDTEMEKTSNLGFVQIAKGDVLIAGLGIGLIIKAVIYEPRITSITVIEKSPNVIKLVKPHLDHPKLTVIEDDIFTWRSGFNFDTIYFDIWADINIDNLTEIRKLKAKYRRKVKSDGWMGAWMEQELRRLKSAESRRYAW